MTVTGFLSNEVSPRPSPEPEALGARFVPREFVFADAGASAPPGAGGGRRGPACLLPTAQGGGQASAVPYAMGLTRHTAAHASARPVLSGSENKVPSQARAELLGGRLGPRLPAEIGLCCLRAISLVSDF